jgi:lipopolysaccharide transport system permease protein
MKRKERTAERGKSDSLIVEAGKSGRLYWADLVRYRELFYFLAWRDVLVRYKQTVIGVAWALLRPLMTMMIFAVIFGRFAGLPSDGVPYPLMVFVGMLPWQFFANALGESSSSLITNTNLITKIYFPRLVIPISSIVVSLIDFLISFLILIALLIWYSYGVSFRVMWVPFFTLVVFACAIGVGLLLAALNVKYRDFRYIVPFVIQIGQYVSPVGFTSTIVPPHLRTYFSLNPLVGIIDSFRWALLGTREFPTDSFLISLVMTVMLLVFGLKYFRATEKEFADII